MAAGAKASQFLSIPSHSRPCRQNKAARELQSVSTCQLQRDLPALQTGPPLAATPDISTPCTWPTPHPLAPPAARRGALPAAAHAARALVACRRRPAGGRASGHVHRRRRRCGSQQVSEGREHYTSSHMGRCPSAAAAP
eukprot:362322-Chlamydomonas_euryale.AAC.27